MVCLGRFIWQCGVTGAITYVPCQQQQPRSGALIRGRKETVLILCTGNSARSQMTEAFFRHEGGGSCEVVSAGTKLSQARPEAIAVTSEDRHRHFCHHSKSWKSSPARSSITSSQSATTPKNCVQCFQAGRSTCIGRLRIRQRWKDQRN